MRAKGTTPPGAVDERQAARWVREMFAGVAPRYDFLNHLLSFQVDRYWRARTVRRLREVIERPGARVLDLCCGTGDLTLALAAAARGRARVYGSDFCHPMLTAAARKGAAGLFEGDALALPLRDGCLDAVTVAFGVRNYANYRRGLEEMLRVLKPGGVAAILEFSRPGNRLLAGFYGFYSRQVLPRVGGLVSGSREAYRYLPESVGKFPDGEGLAREMAAAGYVGVEWEGLSGGIAALHLGRRP